MSGSMLGPNHLPDGQEFVSWERPLRFSKTYHVDANAAQADDAGPGTRERPFKTISRAAQVLLPGERVVIASGIYRETVRPERGGSGPDQLISYEADEGARVTVRGSQVLTGTWQLGMDWRLDRPGAAAEGAARIWRSRLDPALFQGYNPFAVSNIMPDTTYFDGHHIQTFIRRRGMVFVDGSPLQQVNLPYELGAGDGRFWVEENGLALYVRLAGDEDPEGHVIEVTTREQAFAPAQPFLGYIRIRGLTFEHGANGFPVPQRGLVSTGRGHHWIIEDCTIQWANAIGLDAGNECWHRPEPPESFSEHIIRRNTIRQCGICGLAAIKSRNLLVEDNLVEQVGWHEANNAAESAGVKLHEAHDLLFRRNVIRYTVGCPALWLDWDNGNCRVTGNILASVGGHFSFAALHLEASHELNMIDHNIIWDIREGAAPWDWVIDDYPQHETEGNGLNLRGSDHVVIAHNLIGECAYSAVWPVNVPYRVMRGRGGTGRDVTVVNNIIHHCQEAAVHFENEHNYAEGNLYSGFTAAYLRILHPVPQWLDLPTWRAYYGWDQQGTLAEAKITFDSDSLTLCMDLGATAHEVDAFRGLQSDFRGQATGERRLPGPFSDVAPFAQAICVDPRLHSQGH